MSGDAPVRRGRHHRWLLVLPFLWQIAMVPLVNGMAWHGLPLPFPMLWQMAGIVLTSVVIAIVFRLDRRVAPDDGNAEGPPAEGPRP